MKITKDSYVAYKMDVYKGENLDEIVENPHPESPQELIIGLTTSVLEESLNGLEVGDTFDVTHTYEKKYVNSPNGYLVDMDKSLFVDDKGEFLSSQIYEGAFVSFCHPTGYYFCFVKAVHEDKITMNFVRPVKGGKSRYVGTILEVRPSTKEDIERLRDEYIFFLPEDWPFLPDSEEDF